MCGAAGAVSSPPRRFSSHLSSWASWCLRLSVTWALQMSTGCYHTASSAEIASMRFRSPYTPWAVSAVHGAARHIPYNIVTCCCMKSLCVVEGRALLRQMQSASQTYSSIPQQTISDIICPTSCKNLDRERDSVRCQSSSACQTQPLPAPSLV